MTESGSVRAVVFAQGNDRRIKSPLPSFANSTPSTTTNLVLPASTAKDSSWEKTENGLSASVTIALTFAPIKMLLTWAASRRIASSANSSSSTTERMDNTPVDGSNA